MTLPSDHDARVQRAELSLMGLSLGDAFGQCFFEPVCVRGIPYREIPEGPWFYTDDTIMALSIFDALRQFGTIDQDHLAQLFAKRYRRQPNRGYGAGAMRLLERIDLGEDWRVGSIAMFGGEGSMGNGGAMRVAPLGAYFADDLDRVVVEAKASAEVTHAHPDGIAGAIAIAVAAAVACNVEQTDLNEVDILNAAHEHTPEGLTRNNIAKAISIQLDRAPEIAATALGSGQRVLASDTVPFSIWSAAAHFDNFENAMWATASGRGDVDTTCAMVGGIVALSVGVNGLPREWLRRREPLDE